MDADQRILDRIERMEATLRAEIDKVDDRVGKLETTCAEIRTQQKADHSRISRETKRADEDAAAESQAHAGLEARVRALETTVAEAKGARKATLAVAGAGAGGIVGIVEAVKAWINV